MGEINPSPPNQYRAQTLQSALAAKAQKQQFTENAYVTCSLVGFLKRRMVV